MTDIDFSATIRPSIFSGISVAIGSPDDGTGRKLRSDCDSAMSQPYFRWSKKEYIFPVAG